LDVNDNKMYPANSGNIQQADWMAPNGDFNPSVDGIVNHEVGHFLGLNDRYNHNTKKVFLGFNGDLMGDASMRLKEAHYRFYYEYFNNTKNETGINRKLIDGDYPQNLKAATLLEQVKPYPPQSF
jgi:hypothetical protein